MTSWGLLPLALPPVTKRISALAAPWLAFERVTCVERGELRQWILAE